jgi:hypothetical protein
MNDNVETVKRAYAAFQRGDIEGVVQCLNADIVWEPLYGCEGRIPMAGRRTGIDAVREFFRILDANVRFERFEPREFIAENDTVVALGFYKAIAKPTGRPIQSEWAMVFTVKGGKATSFREFTNAAAFIAAFEGVPHAAMQPAMTR